MGLFNFKGLIKKYERYPPVYLKTAGSYGDDGEYNEEVTGEEEFNGAVVPLTFQELKEAENGEYRAEDRKLYCYRDFKTGEKIRHKGLIYRIDRKKDYSDFDDGLNIYYLVRSDNNRA